MKEKIVKLVSDEISDLNVFVDDVFVSTEEGKKILNIVLDSSDTIDLNLITDASRIINKIIDKNKVSPTITASFYSSFIHPTQPRNLTVREAARIQSFDDDFIFYGNKSSIIKQIGNAVPPLFAYYLANVIKNAENGGYNNG